MRGRGKMTWVKFHITGWLHGSIRWQLEPDERGVWADLIVLAGECLAGGKICDNDGVSFPLPFIANQLNIPLELLGRTIAKCKHEGRLINRDDILIITHWQEYQSEYERQRTYREAKAAPKEQLSLPTTDQDLATISRLYEENIGMITPLTAEELKDIASKYSAEWFNDAVTEAVKNNVRKLNYITKILETWAVEGKGTSGARGRGKREAPPNIMKGLQE